MANMNPGSELLSSNPFYRNGSLLFNPKRRGHLLCTFLTLNILQFVYQLQFQFQNLYHPLYIRQEEAHTSSRRIGWFQKCGKISVRRPALLKPVHLVDDF